MRVGSDGVVVTNSTCEAEIAEIPKSLSFPDVSFEMHEPCPPIELHSSVCVELRVLWQGMPGTHLS